MLLTKQIGLATRGKLVSTTDLYRARFLNKKMQIKQIVGSAPAHYELVDGNKVVIYARHELYEMEV